MPTIFIVAFLAFVVLVAIFVAIAVFAFGARPSRRTTSESSPFTSGSDYTNLNP
jgi:NADH:ubiquinone oxidoreductase subunit 3 (subunit A)